MKIGVSANLDKGASIHTDTFLEAIQIGLAHAEQKCAVKPIYVSDHATRDGGRVAAGILVAQGVEAVVGHYASAAACSASAIYREHRLPVFLPAATHPDLDRPGEGIFQLCPNDRDLCAQILAFLAEKGARAVHLECDRSFHGMAVVALLRSLLACSGVRVVGEPHESDCVIFSGMYAASVDYVQRIRRLFQKPILLTDDTCHPNVADALKAWQDIFIFGLASSLESEACREFVEQYCNTTHRAPPTYLLQTMIAMEMAIQHVSMMPKQRLPEAELKRFQWQTRLGSHTLAEIKKILAAYELWELRHGEIIRLHSPKSPLHSTVAVSV